MIEDDLDRYFCDFGEPVIIDGREIVGIFDEQYQEAFDYSPSSMSSEGRVFGLRCQSAQIDFAVHGSTVLIGDRQFTIVKICPEDEGKITRLELKEAC